MISELSLASWLLVGLGALFIGLNKTGLQGLALVAIPIYAAVFGGRASAGVVLPLLIVGDVFGVIYYHRDARLGYVGRLLPSTLVGILAGLLIGGAISDELFRVLIGALVMLGVVFIALREYTSLRLEIPENRLVAVLLGLVGGFATMVGNAAGPLLSLYLLSMGLPKNRFIGTAAWFFFIVNLIKVPLHVVFWGTITGESLLLNAALAVPVIIGALAGVRVVRRIPEAAYRVFLVLVTGMAAVRLFFP